MRYVIPVCKDTTIYDGNALSGNTAMNAGKSEILDIFKSMTSTTTSESSRALLKFDLTAYNTEVASGSIPVGTTRVNFNLKAFNVQGPAANATASSISVLPITRDWDEGNGILNKKSTGVANWLTASYGVPWTAGGSDYDNTVILNCIFASGSEDGVWNANILMNYWTASTNYGVVMMLSGSAETNTISYGNKQFFSKDTNTIYAPVIEVTWDDSIHDDTNFMYANASMSTYLYNYARNGLGNLNFDTSSLTTRVWRDSLDPLAGTLLYKVDSPSYVETGVYKADVVIAGPYNTVVVAWYSASNDLGSMFFSQSMSYYTGSYSGQYDPWGDYSAVIINLREQYEYGEHVKLDVHARPKFIRTFQIYPTESVAPLRVVLFDAHYEITDNASQEVIIPFSEYSRVSYDASSMWFDMWTQGLTANRRYDVRLQYILSGRRVIEDKKFSFFLKG